MAIPAALLTSISPRHASRHHRCVARKGEQPAIEDTLYFGTQKPNGIITNEEWRRFLEDAVTPRFPRGLTVSDASGQWLSANGSPVREATHVLQLVHPEDAADNALVARVIFEYKTRFAQESVLRVKVPACVTFWVLNDAIRVRADFRCPRPGPAASHRVSVPESCQLIIHCGDIYCGPGVAEELAAHRARHGRAWQQ